MKKFIIISLILSLITTGLLFWFGIIEITSKNWMALPVFYLALSLGYWFFGGLFGVLTGLFDPIPEEKTKKKEKKWVSRYSTNTSHKKESTKTKDDDSGDFIKSAAIGYITDNPLIGGAVGGSMSGGILGSSLDGDLFN